MSREEKYLAILKEYHWVRVLLCTPRTINEKRDLRDRLNLLEGKLSEYKPADNPATSTLADTPAGHTIPVAKRLLVDSSGPLGQG